MRILIFNYEYPPLGGGAGNATCFLLREFSKRDDIRIDLITSSTTSSYLERPYANITIHYLDIGKKGNVHYQSNKELLNYTWSSYSYAKSLIRSGRSFDLIHAFFGIPSGYVAMKLGLPYVVSLRGSDVPFYNSRFALADKLLFKRLSCTVWRKARKVVANSAGLRELALSSYSKVPVQVIPNGIDTCAFTPASKSTADMQNKDNRKEEGSTLHIVSTGRLIERKGYDLLITAASCLPDIRITLAGDGPEETTLFAQAERNRVNVEFLGAVNHEHIPELLQSANLFVLPSRNEGMSNSVLEAMACGLPIITTDVGGSKELIDGNGVIIPCDNSKQLRKALQYYLENRDKLREHGQRSRKIAEKMDWEKVAAEYYHLYKIVEDME